MGVLVQLGWAGRRGQYDASPTRAGSVQVGHQFCGRHAQHHHQGHRHAAGREFHAEHDRLWTLQIDALSQFRNLTEWVGCECCGESHCGQCLCGCHVHRCLELFLDGSQRFRCAQAGFHRHWCSTNPRPTPRSIDRRSLQ